jgi:transcription initiation factor TFIIIB Brf1 subunit/transcription initiation factor TFIIB
LGKGMSSRTNNNNPDDDEGSDLATAPPGATSHVGGVVEAFQKCNNCGNNDQTAFVLDAKHGDVICENCGTVVSESIMHEGSQFRKFEGEEDRNHHGDTWNPLYSNSHNLSTTLGGVQMSGGINGWNGGGNKRNLETILRNAHAYTELNVSQFGKTDRRTRIGYKDKQKKEAFHQMQHVGDALNLHEAVVQRAKEIFAGFRDDRELIQQFKAVIGT